MKIASGIELQQIPSNNSSDIEFRDLMKVYKDHTEEPFSFLENHTAFPLDNPLRFRKNVL